MLRLIITNFPLVVYIFLVIYTPPLGPNFILLRYAILLGGPIIIGLHYLSVRDSNLRRIFSYPPFALLLLGSLFGSLYIALVQIFTGHGAQSFGETRILQNSAIVLMLFNCAFIVDMLRRRGFDRKQSFELLLWLGGFQGLFAALGTVIPGIKAISNYLYAAGGGSNEFVIAGRIYGFSTDFTYGTPIYHGALAGLALYFVLQDRQPYRRWVILLLITVTLNGRTGLLVFVGIAALSIIVINFRRSRFFALGGGILALFSSYFILMAFLKRYLPSTFNFVNSFILDTFNLLGNNEATGNYSVLTEEIKLVPEGIGLLFGEGVRLYTNSLGPRTDIGLTNDLFAGGFIYLILLYIPFILFVARVPQMPNLIKIFLIFAWIVANLKGEYFRSSILLFLIIFMVYIYLYPRFSTSPHDSVEFHSNSSRLDSIGIKEK